MGRIAARRILLCLTALSCASSLLIRAQVARQTPDEWINPLAFATPAPGTFGNLGRNALRGPGLWQVDTALTRTIGFAERMALELRVEAFNVFNRAQYGNPNSNLSTPGNFGVIAVPVNQGATGSGTPRQIQLAARLFF